MDVIPKRPIFKQKIQGWSPYTTWRRQHTAAMTCPICGRTFSLENHRIAADGVVWPSVVCPWPPCPYHVFLRLDEWTP